MATRTVDDYPYDPALARTPHVLRGVEKVRAFWYPPMRKTVFELYEWLEAGAKPQVPPAPRRRAGEQLEMRA